MHDDNGRVLERFAGELDRHPEDLGGAICATCVGVLGLPGAAITLRADEGINYTLGTSNEVMAQLNDLERTLGEGPCIDAFDRGEHIFEGDLAAKMDDRWPAFTSGARLTEARAVFGYPLAVGQTRFGAMNLYAANPGLLDEDQHRDALVLANVAVHAVLNAQAGAGTDDLAAELSAFPAYEIAVHQATGMVAVQLDVDMRTAMVAIRARAFATDQTLGSVAEDVVARRTSFTP